VERLSGEDQLILWPDQVWPQDIGAMGVFDGRSLLDSDGRFQIGTAKQAVEARLHLLRRFRQVLYVPQRGLGVVHDEHRHFAQACLAEGIAKRAVRGMPTIDGPSYGATRLRA